MNTNCSGRRARSGRWLALGLAGALLGKSSQGNASTPNFANDVAPILYQSCVVCHHEEGIGPFPLVEYEDARRRARQIASVVDSGYMPPWKPDAGHGPLLKGERRLSALEIRTLLDWAQAGAPSGDLGNVPEPPDTSGDWSLGLPDLVVTLPEAFELEAAGSDRFRNFVIPIPLEQLRYVTAFEFLPRTKLAVHHASFALSTTSEPRRRDAEDPEPGYDSLDLGDSFNPEGHIIGWTPGQVPYETYPGTAWKLEPGVDLLMQLHLLPTGKLERIQPKIGLYFTDEPPDRFSWVAVLREYDIDIPAGAKDYWVEERMHIPVATKVLGLFPHAHYLGKDFQVFAELPDGERRWLLRISDWDFNWQSDYRFEEPFSLPAGTELVMRLRYDNSSENVRNPSDPPRRVRSGWGSFDEMGEVAIQLLLEREEDLPRLEEASARYQLNRPETSAEGYYNLGVALEDQGRTREAIEAYEASVAQNPRIGRAWNNLGALYEAAGYEEKSVAFYERAVEEDPDAQEARLNLARAYLRRGQTSSARGELATLLERNERHREARQMLGVVLMQHGRVAEALSLFEAGRKWHGDDGAYLLDLASAYGIVGRVDDAESTFEEVTRIGSSAERMEAWFTLAQLSKDEGQREEALRRVNKALAENPDALEPMLFKVALQYEVGKSATARSSVAVLVSRTRNDAELLSRLVGYVPFPEGIVDVAAALASDGRRGEAAALLQEAEEFAKASGDERAEALVRRERTRQARLGQADR